ncbi:MAG: hypothetical protein SNJ73_03905 [Acetobacteraceae bacterium]
MPGIVPISAVMRVDRRRGRRCHRRLLHRSGVGTRQGQAKRQLHCRQGPSASLAGGVAGQRLALRLASRRGALQRVFAAVLVSVAAYVAWRASRVL